MVEANGHSKQDPMGRFRRISSVVPTFAQAIDRLFASAVVAVIVAVIYRYCWLDAADPFKCGALLNQGHWIDPPRGPQSQNRGFQTWEPPGCLLHTYQQKDISACFHSKRIVFIGDSTIRQVYWATAKKLDVTAAVDEQLVVDKGIDLNFTRAGVVVEFIWDPYLNSSRLQDELVAYRDHFDRKTDDGAARRDSAALLLLSGGLWQARHLPTNPIRSFEDSVDSVVPYMNPSPESAISESRPLFGRQASANLLLFAPVQVPRYDLLSPARAETITADKVDLMNDYLQQLSGFADVDVVWSFSLMTYQRKSAYEQSGMHVVENVASRKADVVLNLRCNAEASGPRGGYPFDKTCCTNYGRPRWIQWVGLVASLGLLPIAAWIVSRNYRRHHTLPSAIVLNALTTFFLSVAYCFYADRTQIFNKKPKYFVLDQFTLMCSVTLVLGILSIRRSAASSVRAKAASTDQPFLSRFQTDEWKGWMQFIILIYHYTGASKVLWIYQIVRLLVASYLFLTGFGHTVFFIKKGDYSLRRVAGVLIRLNLLSCVLPYMMRTDYLFYYFAPLVSFWFVVVYLTMFIRRDLNDSIPFLLLKVVLSAALVTTLTRIPGCLEAIFFVLRVTCRIHWDVTEWRFRLFLDQFIVYVGMIAAAIFVRLTDQGREKPIPHFNPRVAYAILVVTSLILIPWYSISISQYPTKADSNKWHPYISFLPILSFVILRNSNRHFRNFHSSIFAWLGRCSLETFTLQFHIWLAGDTKGLLSLGLSQRRRLHTAGRLADFLILTPIFLWISWSVAGATNTITQWIVDGGGGEAKPDAPAALELPQIKADPVGSNGLWKPAGHEPRTKIVGRRRILLKAWRESLAVRLGSLLVLMWLLNL